MKPFGSSTSRKFKFLRLLSLQVFFLVVILFAGGAPQAQALEAASSKRPLSLTLSGGVSLASYEAGFIYYLSRHLHDNSRADLKIVTGASAGSINGVISIINFCQPEISSPQKSINWRVWTPLGIKDIADPKKVTPISLFSRDGVEKYSHQIKTEFLKGLRTDCEVVLGIVVTRKKPLKTEIKPGLFIDRHNEFFLVKIKGQGAGRPPSIENFPLHEPGQQQLFLPLGSDPEKNYELLESVFIASAQFPLAFPPFTLSFCDLESTAGKGACSGKDIKKSDFIDGGIFNNTPVNLATIIANRFLKPKDRKNLAYGVITLDGGTHPTPDDKDDDKKPAIIKYLGDLLWQFADTSRNQSLSQIYVSNNTIQDQTFSNDKILPRASQYYMAFTGFIDRGFREYDFYLGMYEGRKFLQRYIRQTKVEAAKKYLQGKIDSESTLVDDPEWRPYFCFIETYDQEAQAKGSCAKINNPSFSLLLKVNSDIVKNRCQEAGEEGKKFKSCKLSAHLKSEASFSKDETDQKFFFRRLQETGYPYELKKTKTASGEDIMREHIEPLIAELIKQQPKDQRFLIANGTSILLNSLDFRPQKSRTAAGIGSHIQFTRAHLLNHSATRPWFFADYGLMARGVDSYLNSNPDSLALAPFIGLASNWTDKNYFWLEPEVGLRFGYNYALKTESDAFCDGKSSSTIPTRCRSMILQPHISISVLNRVRLELGSIILLEHKYKSDFTMLAEIQF